MFEVAINSGVSHQQFSVAHGSLVLALPQLLHGDWRAIDLTGPTCEATCVELREEAGRLLISVLSRHASTPFDLLADLDDAIGERLLIEFPHQMTLGGTRLEFISPAQSPLSSGRNLAELLEDRPDDVGSRVGSPGKENQFGGPSIDTLTRWFSAITLLQGRLASSQEFFAHAAEFAVDPIGMDGAIVWRLRDAVWEEAASYLPYPELGIWTDRSVLEELLSKPKTLFEQQRSEDGMAVNRLSASHAVLVSPLLNEEDEVVGAIYAFRAVHAGNRRRGIRHMEARLMALLAGTVSLGMVRLEREAELQWRRTLTEKAMASQVVDVIPRDTLQLKTESREITVLFADLRNSCSLTAELTRRQGDALLGEILEALSSAVIGLDGVVIDYYGDGLAAMWNAPVRQTLHAELACRSGQLMLHELDRVNRRWCADLPRPVRMGVGIHTGETLVGNVGSDRRIKYGPRGATVNLSSRVESATKRVRLPLLLTAAAARQLSAKLTTYRVCRACVAGFSEPVELFAAEPHAKSDRRRDEILIYERALENFEQGAWDEAARDLEILRGVDRLPVRFLEDEINRRRAARRSRRQSDRDLLSMGSTIDLALKRQ